MTCSLRSTPRQHVYFYMYFKVNLTLVWPWLKNHLLLLILHCTVFFFLFWDLGNATGRWNLLDAGAFVNPKWIYLYNVILPSRIVSMAFSFLFYRPWVGTTFIVGCKNKPVRARNVKMICWFAFLSDLTNCICTYTRYQEKYRNFLDWNTWEYSKVEHFLGGVHRSESGRIMSTKVTWPGILPPSQAQPPSVGFSSSMANTFKTGILAWCYHGEDLQVGYRKWIKQFSYLPT